MPWCPNCKNEYREGIRVCADCGAELIASWEEVNMVPLLSLNQADAAERLAEFMRFEGISQVEVTELTDAQFQLSVPEEEKKDALNLVQVFNTVEKERALAALSEEELEELARQEKEAAEAAKNVHTYVKAEDKYKENKSSGYMFLAVGILGLIFTFLNATGVLSILSGWFSLGIMSGMFVVFLYIGITSLHHAKKLEYEISEEADQTAEITNWMQATLTEETLSAAEDPEAGAEENDILRYDYARKLLTEKYPELDENYVDHLLDEFLN